MTLLDMEKTSKNLPVIFLLLNSWKCTTNFSKILSFFYKDPDPDPDLDPDLLLEPGSGQQSFGFATLQVDNIHEKLKI